MSTLIRNWIEEGQEYRAHYRYNDWHWYVFVMNKGTFVFKAMVSGTKNTSIADINRGLLFKSIFND